MIRFLSIKDMNGFGGIFDGVKNIHELGKQTKGNRTEKNIGMYFKLIYTALRVGSEGIWEVLGL